MTPAGPRNVIAPQLLEEKNKTARERVEEAGRTAYEEVKRKTQTTLADQPQSIGDWRSLPGVRDTVKRGHLWNLLAWYHHEVVRPQLEQYHEQVVKPRLGLRASIRRLFGREEPVPPFKVLFESPWENLAKGDEARAQLAAQEAIEKQADIELARLEKLSGD